MSNRATVQLRADANEHRPEGAHTDTNSSVIKENTTTATKVSIKLFESF